jgi:hypothetical protein
MMHTLLLSAWGLEQPCCCCGFLQCNSWGRGKVWFILVHSMFANRQGYHLLWPMQYLPFLGFFSGFWKQYSTWVFKILLWHWMKLECAQHQYLSLKFQDLVPYQSMKRLVTIEGCIFHWLWKHFGFHLSEQTNWCLQSMANTIKHFVHRQTLNQKLLSCFKNFSDWKRKVFC